MTRPRREPKPEPAPHTEALPCGCEHDAQTGEYIRLCGDYREHTDAVERAERAAGDEQE